MSEEKNLKDRFLSLRDVIDSNEYNRKIVLKNYNELRKDMENYLEKSGHTELLEHMRCQHKENSH